jgi:uncharacterized protein (TIGR03086 family)
MRTTIDATTALERAYDDLAKVVANLDAAQLALPTCSPDWDVKALLNHILGGGLMYAAVNAGEAASEDAGDVVGDDPMRAIAEVARINLESWCGAGALDGDRTYPWGTFPASAGLVINVSEVAVHAWDIAQATGQLASLDTDVATVVYDFYRHVPLDGYRAHGVFGAEVEVADDAPVTDRLLGYLGREGAPHRAEPRPIVVPAARAERLDLPKGSTMQLGVDTTDTGGELSVHRTTLRDGADGAFPHHHEGSTEMFYVVSGSLQILIGDEVVVAGPGDVAVVPPHTTHAFAAAPGSDAEVLVACTPGQSFDFFRRLSRIATGKEEPGLFFADQSEYDIYGDDSTTWREVRT